MDRPPHLIYNPVIIDRFPLEDYPDYPLPQNLPLFCLPMGATIERWARTESRPTPSLSAFVLTSDIAEKVYGALLNLYETISADQLTTDELTALQFVDDPADSSRLQKA